MIIASRYNIDVVHFVNITVVIGIKVRDELLFLGGGNLSQCDNLTPENNKI